MPRSRHYGRTPGEKTHRSHSTGDCPRRSWSAARIVRFALARHNNLKVSLCHIQWNPLRHSLQRRAHTHTHKQQHSWPRCHHHWQRCAVVVLGSAAHGRHMHCLFVPHQAKRKTDGILHYLLLDPKHSSILGCIQFNNYIRYVGTHGCEQEFFCKRKPTCHDVFCDAHLTHWVVGL